VGFERFLKRIFAKSAKYYRRFTCQRNRRGLATRATGINEGGVMGENLHRSMQTLTSRQPLSQETADRRFSHFPWNHGLGLTNDPYSFRLVADAFLHRQHGLSPFQQFLLLYGLSVGVRVL
jgi:hypothetical protein